MVGCVNIRRWTLFAVVTRNTTSRRVSCTSTLTIGDPLNRTLSWLPWRSKSRQTSTSSNTSWHVLLTTPHALRTCVISLRSAERNALTPEKCIIFTRMWLRYVWVFAIVNPSVILSFVCNVGAPYSGGWTFRQNFFTAVHHGHPLTSVKNFTEIVPGETLRRGRSTQQG